MIMNAAGLAVEDLALIYGSSALQTLTGALSYTIVLPFLFVPIFVVLYLLLLIPAYFVGRALGIYQSSEKKREMKELRRKQKLEKKYGISPKDYHLS